MQNQRVSEISNFFFSIGSDRRIYTTPTIVSMPIKPLSKSLQRHRVLVAVLAAQRAPLPKIKSLPLPPTIVFEPADTPAKSESSPAMHRVGTVVARQQIVDRRADHRVVGAAAVKVDTACWACLA
jgi:hypothetical protein